MVMIILYWAYITQLRPRAEVKLSENKMQILKPDILERITISRAEAEKMVNTFMDTKATLGRVFKANFKAVK